MIFAAEASLPSWYHGAEPVDPRTLPAFRPSLVAPPEAPAYTPEVQARLFAAWLVGLVAGIRPLPLLALLGAKGGGKSTLGRSVLRLLLGESGGLTPVSADMRDFWALAQGRPAVGFDNVDGIVPPWFIDALALAVTGGRVQKRELYTDDTVRDRGIRAAVVVTSRTAPFARADVVERALPLFTAEFEDGTRLPDSELDREVAQERSGMLVYLLRQASSVLERQGQAPADLPARFLDFARLVWAWHDAAGEVEAARPVLAAWRAAQALAMGDADPLLAAIVEHAPPGGFQRITASELVRLLQAQGAELPYLGGGKRIASHLRELRSSLAFAGWQLVEGRMDERALFSLIRSNPPGAG
jgi:energy-coupling factor transporter ATP-binding protein EcfA2